MPWNIQQGAEGCGETQYGVVNTSSGAVEGCHDTRADAETQIAALNANTNEADDTAPAATTIAETTALDGGPIQQATESGAQMLVQLISPGWGASGYYTPQVLETAAQARVWPAGTHMYLDHPSATEQHDRPERSVRDLAAVLTEDARWDGHGLVAPARVFAPYREHLAEAADSIGVSIRATATAERGEAEGKQGPIVTELHEGLSVDFVTHAGRGGRVLHVLESAHQAAAAEALPGGHTMDSLRDALRTAVADTHGGENTFAFVRDFDDEQVFYDLDTEDGSTTYQQGYTTSDEGSVSLDGERQQVQARIQYVPVETSPPAGPDGGAAAETADHDPSTREDTTMDGNQGAGGAPATPRQIMEQRDNEQRRQIAELRARERARDIVSEALGDAWLTPSTTARLTGELLENLPLAGEDLQLDEQALRDRCLTARDRAESEVAEALQAAGMGQPRQLGQPAAGQGGEQVNLGERLESAFRGMGVGESVAKTAAKGR